MSETRPIQAPTTPSAPRPTEVLRRPENLAYMAKKGNEIHLSLVSGVVKVSVEAAKQAVDAATTTAQERVRIVVGGKTVEMTKQDLQALKSKLEPAQAPPARAPQQASAPQQEGMFKKIVRVANKAADVVTGWEKAPVVFGRANGFGQPNISGDIPIYYQVPGQDRNVQSFQPDTINQALLKAKSVDSKQYGIDGQAIGVQFADKQGRALNVVLTTEQFTGLATLAQAELTRRRAVDASIAPARQAAPTVEPAPQPTPTPEAEPAFMQSPEAMRAHLLQYAQKEAKSDLKNHVVDDVRASLMENEKLLGEIGKALDVVRDKNTSLHGYFLLLADSLYLTNPLLYVTKTGNKLPDLERVADVKLLQGVLKIALKLDQPAYKKALGLWLQSEVAGYQLQIDQLRENGRKNVSHLNSDGTVTPISTAEMKMQEMYRDSAKKALDSLG